MLPLLLLEADMSRELKLVLRETQTGREATHWLERG